MSPDGETERDQMMQHLWAAVKSLYFSPSSQPTDFDLVLFFEVVSSSIKDELLKSISIEIGRLAACDYLRELPKD